MFESMQFTSIGEFFQMGGYAFNVWSVYVLFAAFFFINLFLPLLKKKQIIREQKRRLVVNRESGDRGGNTGVLDTGPAMTGENT